MRVPGVQGGLSHKRVSGVMKSVRSHVGVGYQKAPQRSSSTKNKSKNMFFKISIKQGKHVVQALKQKTEEARTQNLPRFHTTLSQNSFPPSEKERKERKTISTRQTQWLTSISPPLKKVEAGSF